MDLLNRNIEEAVKFPGLPQHRQLTYATKQLISREVIQLVPHIRSLGDFVGSIFCPKRSFPEFPLISSL